MFVAGFALERFAAVPGATVGGLLLGLIGASLVPAKTGCGVSTTQRPE